MQCTHVGLFGFNSVNDSHIPDECACTYRSTPLSDPRTATAAHCPGLHTPTHHQPRHLHAHTHTHTVDCDCSLKEVVRLSHAGPKVWDSYANSTGVDIEKLMEGASNPCNKVYVRACASLCPLSHVIPTKRMHSGFHSLHLSPLVRVPVLWWQVAEQLIKDGTLTMTDIMD